MRVHPGSWVVRPVPRVRLSDTVSIMPLHQIPQCQRARVGACTLVRMPIRSLVFSDTSYSRWVSVQRSRTDKYALPIALSEGQNRFVPPVQGSSISYGGPHSYKQVSSRILVGRMHIRLITSNWAAGRRVAAVMVHLGLIATAADNSLRGPQDFLHFCQ